MAVGMSFNTSYLTPTSSKSKLKWREPKLTFILVGADGVFRSAHTTEDKLRLLDAYEEHDCLLAVRQVQFPLHQEVMVVDTLDQARLALKQP